jgi:hypothetical protein
VTVAVVDSTNAAARATTSFHWTVRDRNAPPVATARPGFVVTTPPDVALANVAIDATDMDSCDHLTMALRPGDVLPAGVTFSYRDTYATGTADTCPRNRVFTGAFAGTPTTTGTTSFTIVVSDGKVQVPYAFTWTVSKATPADNRAPVCSAAVATPGLLWPPNHRFVPIAIGGISDPDGDPVTLKITRILQDEPTLAFGEDDDNGRGTGHTPVDGMGVGTSQAQVRAERSGRGDGRVYEIRFTASDARGMSCSGAVNVGVPHDQGPKGGPTDSKIRFDSTGTSWLSVLTAMNVHYRGDDCDHDHRRGGHHDGDGCEHDRTRR